MDIIDNLILDRNTELDNWSNLFHTKVVDYNSSSGNTAFISYERTLSSTINYYLCNRIKQTYRNVFAVNEFAIKNRTITDVDRLTGEEETGVYAEDWKHYCVFDGYFYEEKSFTLLNTQFKHLFVEYKLDDEFSYLKLAIDYLKFKFFTKNISNTCAFCYVIIDKRENNPSIINFYPINNIYYYLLNRKISASTLPVANIYIYLPGGDIHEALTESVILSSKKLEEIANKISLIEDKTTYSEEEMKIINLAESFKKNVLSSKLMVLNFEYIKKVFKKSKELNIFNSFENIQNKDDLLNEAAKYNKNLENYIKRDQRITAEKSGFNTSHKTSLNYLSLIDYFAQEYLEFNERPDYSFKIIKGEKGKETIDNSKIADDNISRIKEHFGKIDNEKREKAIMTLAYSLLYCITNLLPLLFEFNENGDFIKERDAYRMSKLQTKFDKFLKEIANEIKYKNKLDFYSFVGQNKNQEKQMEFVKTIIEKW